MNGKEPRKPWKITTAFLVGIGLVILATVVAKKSVSEGSVNEVLNNTFSFFERHIWELAGLSSLAAGIWFSLIRRRVVSSLFYLFLAFLFSFVLPNFF